MVFHKINIINLFWSKLVIFFPNYHKKTIKFKAIDISNSDKVDAVAKLIELHADVNIRNQLNETVLHVASAKGTPVFFDKMMKFEQKIIENH